MLWLIFGLIIVGMLALDLGVFHRKSHEIQLKEAFAGAAVWIGLGLGFGLLVYQQMGSEKALQYLTGYVIEESLSVDNLFVFLVIFSYFQVPRPYEHKVLFWGIIGAILMRGIFITTGVVLIQRFHFVLYLFGLILLATAVKLALKKDEEVHPERNWVLRIFRPLMPVAKDYEGGKFFVRQEGRWFATPLFVTLLVVESTDVIFAVDSVPAILGITHDPFIVYTSNIFAILGLRSIFFALSGMMKLFHHLHYGLAVILGFVGVKMLLAELYKIPVGVALGVVACVLAASVFASIIWPKRSETAGETPP